MFAATADLFLRLDIQSPTDHQTARAELLLDQATAAITAAVDKDDDWAADYDVPLSIEGICLDVAARAFNAAPGLRSEQETLGAHSRSVSYPDHAASGVQLTDDEQLRARRIVFGSNSGGARAESMADDLSENYPA